ncbi:MAG: hypothetical protein EBW12_03015 [Actinobacteria bacterium]|nr:hypothetical protein [Actinomycetota bacterium]
MPTVLVGIPLPLKIVFGIDFEDRAASLTTSEVLPAGNASGLLINVVIKAKAMRVVLVFIEILVSRGLGKF